MPLPYIELTNKIKHTNTAKLRQIVRDFEKCDGNCESCAVNPYNVQCMELYNMAWFEVYRRTLKKNGIE